jgi:hypothetical protein
MRAPSVMLRLTATSAWKGCRSTTDVLWVLLDWPHHGVIVNTIDFSSGKLRIERCGTSSVPPRPASAKMQRQDMKKSGYRNYRSEAAANIQ